MHQSISLWAIVCYRGNECTVGHSTSRGHFTGGVRMRRSADDGTDDRLQFRRKQQSVRRRQSCIGWETTPLRRRPTPFRLCHGQCQLLCWYLTLLSLYSLSVDWSNLLYWNQAAYKYVALLCDTVHDKAAVCATKMIKMPYILCRLGLGLGGPGLGLGPQTLALQHYKTKPKADKRLQWASATVRFSAIYIYSLRFTDLPVSIFRD